MISKESWDFFLVSLVALGVVIGVSVTCLIVLIVRWLS